MTFQYIPQWWLVWCPVVLRRGLTPRCRLHHDAQRQEHPLQSSRLSQRSSWWYSFCSWCVVKVWNKVEKKEMNNDNEKIVMDKEKRGSKKEG